MHCNILLKSLVSPCRARLSHGIYFTVSNRFSIPMTCQIRNFRSSLINRFGQICYRQIHVSSRHYAPPVIAALIVKLTTPLSRLAFLLVGRRFRKWWEKLPPEMKEKYLGRFSKNKNRMLALLTGFAGLSAGYYFYHLEETPVTGRKRFIILNRDHLQAVAEVQWRNLDRELANNRLPVNTVEHMRVVRVARRLLEANRSKEVNALTWEINVIDNSEVNAFVLANGQIYVYTGMLAAVANDNELAGVLGHEMAHAILNHSGEQLSRGSFVNIYALAVFTLLWAVIPTDGVALFASWLTNTVEDLLLTLPYSRKLEKEADEIGLLLAARACYDIRQVPQFWERMCLEESGKNVDWLSSHPSNESRVIWLKEWLPDALQLREDVKCPKLNDFWMTTRFIAGKE